MKNGGCFALVGFLAVSTLGAGCSQPVEEDAGASTGAIAGSPSVQADVAADNEAFLKRLEDALTKAVSTKKGLEAFTPLQNGEGGDAGVDFTTAKKFCSENDAERGATTVTADKWKVTIEGSATDKTVKLRTFFVLEVRDYTSSQISSGNGLFLAIYDAQGTLVDARARLGPNSFYKWHRSTPSEFQKELMACRPHYA